jgi:S1-C subfamily serine protease
MWLDLTCPACGFTQRATDAVFEQVITCSSCGGRFPVTRPAETWPVESPRPAGAEEPPARPGRPGLRNQPQPRLSLPPWAYAMLGGAGTLFLVAIIVLVRSTGITGPDRSPSPADPPRSSVDGGAPLSTAQIVARCEPSVALVKGKVSSGTGFLIRPDVIATNAHVLDDEFIPDLEVSFPSAPTGRRGPIRAELLYEDPGRDLALLAVRSGLPALELARSYRFLKGEDVIVIGNPGLGDEVVLENAISRGVMSSRTTIDGQDYLQMSIAINPGNSGGPIFDSAGRVIGVATLKSSKAESLGFGIPVEELHAALIRLDLQPDQARAATASRHRTRAAFKMLTGAGVLYALALDVRADVLARMSAFGPDTDLLPTQHARALDETLKHLEHRQFSQMNHHLADLGSDAALTEAAKHRYEDLATNYRAMKELYLHPSRPAEIYASRAGQLKGRHLQLVNALRKELDFHVPREQMAVLESAPRSDLPPDALAQLVPGDVWPRLSPYLFAPPPRPPALLGPGFGSGWPGGFNPGQEAEARARALQRKIQEELQKHRQALQRPLGP